jgi:hypothetical protein
VLVCVITMLVLCCCVNIVGMGVWKGVAMESLKFYLGPLCPTILRPVGGPPLQQPYGRFRGGPSTGRAACGCPLPLWTLPTVRL